MQSVSSRIWTRVAVSNSYDDDHYTTGTSIKNCFILNSCRDQYLSLLALGYTAKIQFELVYLQETQASVVCNGSSF